MILAVCLGAAGATWAPMASAADPEPDVTKSASGPERSVAPTQKPDIPDPVTKEPPAPEPPTQEPDPPNPPTQEPGAPTPSVEASPEATPEPSTVTDSPTPTSTESPTSQATDEAVPATSTRTPPPITAPARQDSPVTVGSILIALAVLLAAVALLIVFSRRKPARPLDYGSAPSPPVWTEPRPAPPVSSSAAPDTTRFLVALGEAMIDAGDPVTDVTKTLQRVAHRNGIPDAEVVVFATALMVSLPGGEQVSTAVASAGVRGLRLDQIDEVFDVAQDAQTTGLTPVEGVGRLASIRLAAPPWGFATRVTGYAMMSAGLALVLGASAAEIAVAAALGAVLGALQLAGGGLTSTYRSALPLIGAFGVSLAVFLLARTTWDIGAFAPLIAPLVGLLPGALLTTGVLELATGQMISGAGRLAAGAMRLFLLAVGIVAAAQLVGVPTGVVTDVADQPLAPWGPWVGVAIFGVGIVLHLCARPSATGWILLVLYVAYAGQVIGGLFLGGVLSAFTGAVLMTPVAVLASRHRSGPTPLVSFLPAFWLLVPGALSLIGITKYLGNEPVYGAASMLTAGETMVAIALGVLVGTSLAASVTRTRGGMTAWNDPSSQLPG